MNILILKKSNILKILIAVFIIIAGIMGSKNYIKDVFNEIGDINKLKAISSVDTNENKIALSFEVHETTYELDKTLSILKEQNINATFFVVGAWAQKNPNAIKQIYECGHEIGSHSYTHSHTENLTKNDFKQDVKACSKVIKNITGITINTYKFPYDDYKNENINIVYDESLYPISASVISNDYKEESKSTLINNILNNKSLKNGAIIEFKVGSKYLNESLPDIIKGLQEKEYKFVTINELIYKENFTVTNDGLQKLN